jgi:hypothetical protein
MELWFKVQHVDVDRLLAHWRWLCPASERLIARNAFGDLFLETDSGEIGLLDVSVGKLERIAESEARFRELVEDPGKRDEWFSKADETGFAAKGLVPSESQCIGFSPPLVLAEEPHEPYLVDIHEHVSFLGDLNRQIADLPDGRKIKLIVGERPLATDH